MTAKTMQPSPRKFNMPALRRRAKKLMRSKYKKTISLSLLDKVWSEYVEHGIKAPLIKFGKVEIDSKLSLEIVGTKIIDDPKMMALITSGRNVTTKGTIKKAVVFDRNRPNVKYKIVLTDKGYMGGNLVFHPDRKLSRAVHESLKNTNTYYRIENVS